MNTQAWESHRNLQNWCDKLDLPMGDTPKKRKAPKT